MEEPSGVADGLTQCLWCGEMAPYEDLGEAMNIQCPNEHTPFMISQAAKICSLEWEIERTKTERGGA